MATAKATTTAKERASYRRAVQSTLHSFYGKTEREAAHLVKDWWEALSESGVLTSPLLLHAEPMNTAADIAEVRELAINSANRDAYRRILEDSWKTPKSKSKTRPEIVEVAPASERAATKTRPRAVPKTISLQELQSAAS